jgi:mutator protein MutT
MKQSVWAIILDHKGRVLITKRSKKSNNPNLLNVPGGGIEGDERAIDSIVRELQEEVGINHNDLQVINDYYFIKGKRVIHVYTFITRVKVKVQLNHEASEYRWIAIEQAAKKAKDRSKWHLQTFHIFSNIRQGKHKVKPY